MIKPRHPGRLDEDQGKPDLVTRPSPHPWDGFIRGLENELAFASAQALARGQREGISPLVVHGPAGVGKTRLLSGLVREWLERQPAAPIAHVQGADFRESCLEAMRQPDRRNWAELHERFRAVDLLIVDDVEQLEGQIAVQSELVHILDALDACGGSVAISSHDPPSRWSRTRWQDRLTTRLAGGLMARLEPPGYASRRAYLMTRITSLGLRSSVDAVDLLASSAAGYRTLDGWLSQLAFVLEAGVGRLIDHRSNRTARSVLLDLTTARNLLAGEPGAASTSISVKEIAAMIAAQLGVRVAALRGPGRQARLVQARHLAMYLARLHTDSSFALIGSYFGRRDPATVRHACKVTAMRLATDPSFAAILNSLRLPPLAP